jgi:hypothetical protein
MKKRKASAPCVFFMGLALNQTPSAALVKTLVLSLILTECIHKPSHSALIGFIGWVKKDERTMKNSSLRRELLWFVFAVGAVVLALGAWDAWERRAEMVAERRTELRHVLDLASGIVRNGKQSVREGMPLDEAKRNVARRLAQLRYGEDGYVGAFGDGYDLLVHPDPKLVGTNVRAVKDSAGQPIFENLYAQGKAGGGYTRYQFPRPGTDQALPKISYATYDADWGWLLFTGLYVDDVDQAFYGTLWRQGGVTLGLLVLLLAAALRFFRTHILGQRAAQSARRDRPPVRRPGADAATPGRGGAQHCAFHGFHCRGLAADRGGQHGPVGSHREAGRRAGADRRQRGADHRDRAAERATCA